MLEIETGSVVLSVAGHDSGKHFLVLRRDGDFVLLADGKSRKLEKPKRKKIKHVRPAVAGAIEVTDDLTDKKIRTLLGELNLR